MNFKHEKKLWKTILHTVFCSFSDSYSLFSFILMSILCWVVAFQFVLSSKGSFNFVSSLLEQLEYAPGVITCSPLSDEYSPFAVRIRKGCSFRNRQVFRLFNQNHQSSLFLLAVFCWRFRRNIFEGDNYVTFWIYNWLIFRWLSL